MSIHYLLDGYNVIHQMPKALNLPELEEQRRYLIRFIEQYAPQGSSNNRVTIVFDGSLDIFGGMTSPLARIIFSHGESADDKIKKIVAQMQNTKNVVVVSDDRDIQYAVRALGAKVSSVQAFLDKIKVSGKDGRLSRKEKRISKSDEAKITSEFGKIWLKPKCLLFVLLLMVDLRCRSNLKTVKQQRYAKALKRPLSNSFSFHPSNSTECSREKRLSHCPIRGLQNLVI